MKTNVRKNSVATHEGAKAKQIKPEHQLRRSVMSCLLFEKEFYEDGEDIASRIAKLVPAVEANKVSQIAIEAREKMKLRHAPLLIVREMARYASHKHLVKHTLSRVIQRADELSEFVALYWKDGKQPLSAQVKKGLAEAFKKFDEYQLAKYDRKGRTVSLCDVLRLVHPVPETKGQEELWGRLRRGELKTPDTWETALSSGGNKKEQWERLLSENKLGALALLRNLRNFRQNDVDENLVLSALENMKVERVLPFRFISAANHAPQWEPQLESAMLKCLDAQEKLYGHSIILLDVSGSMDASVSIRSDITRRDAACGVAMLLREICHRVDIYTFSMKLVQVPARRGFALRDAVIRSQESSGTFLGAAIKSIYAPKDFSLTKAKFGWHGTRKVDYKGQALDPDRLIIITDEQSHDPVPDPKGRAYMINVASNKNGVGYGSYIHIDGWSEAVVDYIRELEKSALA